MKLNEFKIKELKKQIPHNRLKPLRKANVANQSVDSKMHRDNSLIKEESGRGKRASNSRKIIRDKSQQHRIKRRDTNNSVGTSG